MRNCFQAFSAPSTDSLRTPPPQSLMFHSLFFLTPLHPWRWPLKEGNCRWWRGWRHDGDGAGNMFSMVCASCFPFFHVPLLSRNYWVKVAGLPSWKMRKSCCLDWTGGGSMRAVFCGEQLSDTVSKQGWLICRKGEGKFFCYFLFLSPNAWKHFLIFFPRHNLLALFLKE